MSFLTLKSCQKLCSPTRIQSYGRTLLTRKWNTQCTHSYRRYNHVKQSKQLHSSTVSHKPTAIAVNHSATQHTAYPIDRYAAISLSTYDLVWQYIHQKRYKSTPISSYVWLLIRFTIILNICRTLLFDLTTVSGVSMVPTFDSKHNIVVFENINKRLHDVCNKLLVYLNALELDINTAPINSPIPYKRGDIIIAQHPDHTARRLIVKRIVGLPGDTLTYTIPNTTNTKTITIPYNNLFVLGDNPVASYDSRMYGALDYNMVIGKVIARIWPLSKIQWCNTSYYNNHVDIQCTNDTTHHDEVEHDFKQDQQ